MRHFFLLLLCLGACVTSVHAWSEKANTVVIRPGEVLYVRFDRKGTALKVVDISKEANDTAQVILHFSMWDKTTKLINFEIENKFDRELTYKAEARLPSINLRRTPTVVPVVAEKVAFESWPVPIEQLALFGFVLAR